MISVSGDGPTATLTAESLGNATIVASINGGDRGHPDRHRRGNRRGCGCHPGQSGGDHHPSGESYTINATVEMEEEYQDSPATIQWSSNNTSVATVSEDGVITARQVGNAIIKGVAGTQTVEISVEVVENTSTDNSTHDATQDVGQEPEDGTQTDTGDTGTGTGTGDSTGTGDTGTGSGTGGSTDTGTGSGGSTDTGDTGTGSYRRQHRHRDGHRRHRGNRWHHQHHRLTPNPTANIPGGPRRARLFVLKRRRYLCRASDGLAWASWEGPWCATC